MQCKTVAQEGILLSAQAVIDNNLADVMSLSYGQLEGESSSDDTLVNDLWEQAASQGETGVVSAGDSGPDVEDDGNTFSTSGITASSFSTTAWNVSAGGTDFQDLYNGTQGDSTYGISTYWNSSNGTGLGSAKSYVPEMTWNDTCASSIYNSYSNGMSADGAIALLDDDQSVSGCRWRRSQQTLHPSRVANGHGIWFAHNFGISQPAGAGCFAVCLQRLLVSRSALVRVG